MILAEDYSPFNIISLCLQNFIVSDSEKFLKEDTRMHDRAQLKETEDR